MPLSTGYSTDSGAPPQPGALTKGDRLYGYRVLGTLGRGKFSTVYHVKAAESGDHATAQRQHQHHQAALKRIGSKHVKPAEVDVLLRIGAHANLVELYTSCFSGQGFLDLVLEFCSLGDLKRWIRRAQHKRYFFAEPDIWRIAHELASALAHIHALFVVHRDVKPANIFLNEKGVCKLGDFGLSKVLEGDLPGREAGGNGSASDDNFLLRYSYSKVGTPLYMAPEILAGRGYDVKCDLWSCGCVIYELVKLRHPFRERSHAAGGECNRAGSCAGAAGGAGGGNKNGNTAEDDNDDFDKNMSLFALFRKIQKGNYRKLDVDGTCDAGEMIKEGDDLEEQTSPPVCDALRRLVTDLLELQPEKRPSATKLLQRLESDILHAEQNQTLLRQFNAVTRVEYNYQPVLLSTAKAAALLPSSTSGCLTEAAARAHPFARPGLNATAGGNRSVARVADALPPFAAGGAATGASAVVHGPRKPQQQPRFIAGPSSGRHTITREDADCSLVDRFFLEDAPPAIGPVGPARAEPYRNQDEDHRPSAHENGHRGVEEEDEPVFTTRTPVHLLAGSRSPSRGNSFSSTTATPTNSDTRPRSCSGELCRSGSFVREQFQTRRPEEILLRPLSERPKPKEVMGGSKSRNGTPSRSTSKSGRRKRSRTDGECVVEFSGPAVVQLRAECASPLMQHAADALPPVCGRVQHHGPLGHTQADDAPSSKRKCSPSTSSRSGAAEAFFQASPQPASKKYHHIHEKHFYTSPAFASARSGSGSGGATASTTWGTTAIELEPSHQIPALAAAAHHAQAQAHNHHNHLQHLLNNVGDLKTSLMTKNTSAVSGICRDKNLPAPVLVAEELGEKLNLLNFAVSPRACKRRIAGDSFPPAVSFQHRTSLALLLKMETAEKELHDDEAPPPSSEQVPEMNFGESCMLDFKDMQLQLAPASSSSSSSSQHHKQRLRKKQQFLATMDLAKWLCTEVATSRLCPPCVLWNQYDRIRDDILHNGRHDKHEDQQIDSAISDLVLGLVNAEPALRQFCASSSGAILAAQNRPSTFTCSADVLRTELARGYGESLCRVLNDLATTALVQRNFHFGAPEWGRVRDCLGGRGYSSSSSASSSAAAVTRSYKRASSTIADEGEDIEDNDEQERLDRGAAGKNALTANPAAQQHDLHADSFARFDLSLSRHVQSGFFASLWDAIAVADDDVDVTRFPEMKDDSVLAGLPLQKEQKTHARLDGEETQVEPRRPRNEDLQLELFARSSSCSSCCSTDMQIADRPGVVVEEFFGPGVISGVGDGVVPLVFRDDENDGEGESCQVVIRSKRGFPRDRRRTEDDESTLLEEDSYSQIAPRNLAEKCRGAGPPHQAVAGAADVFASVDVGVSASPCRSRRGREPEHRVREVASYYDRAKNNEALQATDMSFSHPIHAIEFRHASRVKKKLREVQAASTSCSRQRLRKQRQSTSSTDARNSTGARKMEPKTNDEQIVKHDSTISTSSAIQFLQHQRPQRAAEDASKTTKSRPGLELLRNLAKSHAHDVKTEAQIFPNLAHEDDCVGGDSHDQKFGTATSSHSQYTHINDFDMEPPSRPGATQRQFPMIN